MLTEKDYCDWRTVKYLESLGMNVYTKVKGIEVLKSVHLYEAQKFLRENKQIDISITLYMEGYAATIKHFYVFEGEFAWKEPIILQCRKSQEEALLEGIKEAIKILKEER